MDTSIDNTTNFEKLTHSKGIVVMKDSNAGKTTLLETAGLAISCIGSEVSSSEILSTKTDLSPTDRSNPNEHDHRETKVAVLSLENNSSGITISGDFNS